MSADFWAGYVSGAASIIIGNPLDITKVRRQLTSHSSCTDFPPVRSRRFLLLPRNFIIGAAAPIVGYGGLNALLFVTYNRLMTILNCNSSRFYVNTLWATFLSGTASGLATWVLSAPIEVVKCRAQVSTSPIDASCWRITKSIYRHEGIRGFYLGGVVTALRDSIGYGFYFWTYGLTTHLFSKVSNGDSPCEQTYKMIMCGGIAGIATWASVFPLDVIKTRVQTQASFSNCQFSRRRLSTIQLMRNTYRNEGLQVFFRGLTVCSIRAFIVNAAQWVVYERVLRELNPESKSLTHSS
ncbi:Mitochondrial basic amino acids transporter [Golovinomyces cichoracearum]|uniref:Mitochondrial basic amino acids transporter n=1 Tax=Golovinomyces cichoracearum TaxID=62708 RepID=A0A420IUG4_9PEZI|nr:Mitochondrial basic amino acids transporter [Golovinomyces cichoracearum]